MHFSFTRFWGYDIMKIIDYCCKEEKIMKSKKGIVFMIVGALLIFAALFLLLYNRNEDEQAAQASDEVLAVIRQDISEREAAVKDDPLYMNNGKEMLVEMPVVEIDGYGYIGYLSIPVLNLELPVMAEWDYARLKIAPCRQSGSISDDDLVIAGHNYRSHFAPLSRLAEGDTILFTTMNGETVTYTVGRTEVLNPDQGEEMLNSEWDLTLYTCTYGGRTRWTVRAYR